jgi:hypothetical protein
LPVIQDIIAQMDAIHLNRDQLIDGSELVFGSIELSTKVKTMFTREYNKGHSVVKITKEDEDEEEDVPYM